MPTILLQFPDGNFMDMGAFSHTNVINFDNAPPYTLAFYNIGGQPPLTVPCSTREEASVLTEDIMALWMCLIDENVPFCMCILRGEDGLWTVGQNERFAKPKQKAKANQ